MIPSGEATKIMPPSANAVFDLIGKVDLREQGGVYNSPAGQGGLYIDSPPSQQGGVWNRT